MSTPIFPVPEALSEERISVKAGTGSMQVNADAGTKRTMRVPLGSTPADRHVRAHEMAHFKYSPARMAWPKGVENIAVQRAEDMRMNFYCRKDGLDDAMDAPILTPDMFVPLILQPMATGELLPAVSAACSTFMTGDYADVISLISGISAQLANDVDALMHTLWTRMVNAGTPTWDDAMANAQALMDFCYPPQPEPEPQPQDGGQDENPDPQPEGDEDSEPMDGGAGDGSDDGGENEPADSAGDGDGEDGDAQGDDGDSGAGSEPSDGTGDDPQGSESDGPVGTGSGDAGDNGAYNPDDAAVAGDKGDWETGELPADPMDALVDDMLDSQTINVKPDPSDEFSADVEKAIAKMLYRADTGGHDELVTDYWGEEYAARNIRVVEMPKPERLVPSKLRARQAIPSEFGMVPKHVDRFCTDRQIFAGQGKRRKNGGAVLIDCSGSMKLTQEQVEEIMYATPAGLIAAYNGYGYSNSSGGEIRILARKGKGAARGSAVRPPHGENVIDYEALLWLVSQKPYDNYFWLSDGKTSGRLGNICRPVAEKCAEVCRKNKVLRVDTLPQLLKALAR
jgi:hypothetical protein